jgi:hypothetical protein
MTHQTSTAAATAIANRRETPNSPIKEIQMTVNTPKPTPAASGPASVADESDALLRLIGGLSDGTRRYIEHYTVSVTLSVERVEPKGAEVAHG